ncbi:chromate efflux transporter [Sphingomonas sp. M1-B02]|uniref:chromate efflux transporter n=1 Tax=Sphingomonas sp. M1-B02 TaxID=3114300 RepID=UPI00223F6741|nr:chromate efflux transporter [Sphingomonas sp. S6-11]UZK64813.1 chromate efflux transporter [Sphingomonas sp. S6-11]
MSDFAPPPFSELVRVSARIGWLSFGGPAGQIALMHRELVDERKWISEAHFLHALNFCHLLPGPEAQQLATYIGWKLHGVRGGLAAGLLFVVPGALVMLALAAAYISAAQLGWFAALFLGVKAAVIAIVLQALLRVGGRALTTNFKRGIALVAFLALFLFSAPFPLVVLGAGVIGALAPAEWLGVKDGRSEPPGPRPRLWKTLATVIAWGAVWAAPMLLVLLLLGREHVLWEIGIFFSQLAVVTFGGAYAVLAYMAQEAVQTHGWLSAGEMADGLGLAETTPGPLILVTQFVGFLAGWREGGVLGSWGGGIAGAALTTWVTFAPCFLWIFAFAPWIDRLQSATRLKGGLAALTAAVVGVIANLSVWFAIHVLFARVDELRAGPLRVGVPDWASFEWRAGLLAAVAGVLLMRFNLSVLTVLAIAAAGGLALSFVA